MSEENSIQVNFGKPMPLFPLDQATVLPQQVLPLHIFEPRYRQMVEHALDGAGQIAMAVFEGNRWKQEYHGRPPLRPAVCIAQIVQHEKLPDGRYNLLIQGVCRAKIIRELGPEKERQYRLALLEPVGVGLPGPESGLESIEGEEILGPSDDNSPALSEVRNRIREMLDEGPLTQMMHAAAVLEYVKNDELPTSAVLELVSFTLITDPRLRYQLLAEPHAEDRARIIVGELEHLSGLIRRAAEQHPEDWPKGCSWN
ncbi:hypothetical protein PHYC_03692 [Phycisphaerales bacterium]|nr:hypothetical protein PHYC_03692 [Phycisphaerales bacterium]